MTTNEPTTGEIVLAIRLCEEGEINCTKCPFANKSCGDLNLLAADRLESQAKQIEELKAEIVQYRRETEELTARAESAERERDAAVDLTAIRIMRYIIKNDVEIEEWNEPCELCEHHNSTHGICGNCYSTENFELRKDCRGLQPQDGGKI